ncbi:MAG TPA: PilX N-terminal domain-containing pilus assembly protein, partial [Candidatus Angelobacter sp.]|nr:PilX N-terminal domain-containing pilus assembly protein [Candidatus Angelobacter sp.]
MNKKTKSHLKHQRGIAMIVALLSLVLLAAIGMALMFMADTENSVNNNYRDSQKAYFAARAGAETVRLQLSSGGSLNASATALTMPLSAGGTGILYVKNPVAGEAIDPTTAPGSTTTANPYLDDQLCWEKYTGLATLSPGSSGPCGSNNQSSQLMSTSTSFSSTTLATAPGVNGADALPFKWVRITNKQNLIGPLGQKVNSALADGLQVCWNGIKEMVITAGTCGSQVPQTMMPVWQLTSVAVTPKVGLNPGSRRIVQMEVALTPPINPPGAVAAQAPIGLQGNLQVNGYDNCTCTATNASRPGKTCDGSHLAVFSANDVSQIGNAATLSSGVGSGLTTYDKNGNVITQGATAANQPWPYDVNQMISDYKTSAQNAATTAPWNFSCSGSPVSCGTQTGQSFGTYPTGLPSAPVFLTGGPATVYIPG